ncbi:MAG: hypothetical protein MZV64_28850 [Ignavibacteriales bacterium]|nr:hypothetical protein [Ignavibacteriales bacterium]
MPFSVFSGFFPGEGVQPFALERNCALPSALPGGCSPNGCGYASGLDADGGEIDARRFDPGAPGDEQLVVAGVHAEHIDPFRQPVDLVPFRRGPVELHDRDAPAGNDHGREEVLAVGDEAVEEGMPGARTRLVSK